MYCKECGKEIHDKAVVCVHCGCAVNPLGNLGESISNNRGLVVLLLCFFLGTFGVHRFYVGKIWSGLFMLVTFGFFGIMYIFDLVMIALGEFTDGAGKKIKL